MAMQHPFIEPSDLEELSMEELQEKVTDLNQKLTFAFRTGNQPLIHQLQLVLESYNSVYKKKMDEAFDNQNVKTTINVESNK